MSPKRVTSGSDRKSDVTYTTRERLAGVPKAEPFGESVPPVSFPAYGYGWRECFGLLKRLGFAPSRILDIGANRGGWTREAVAFFPSASYVLVEPQGALEAGIEDLRQSGHDIRWITAGISDVAGSAQLSVTADSVSSSFLPTPEQAKAHGFSQVLTQLRTIDDIASTTWGAAPDMIKIDAEGYDLKALKGAARALGKTEVFFVEAAICANGIPNTLEAVIRVMAEAGYRVFDLTDVNRSPRTGALWLCELVFVRTISPLFEGIKSYA